MRLYLDACAIIYAVQGAPALRTAVKMHITTVEASPNGALITSRLSRLECRVGPLRDNDAALLSMFDLFLDSPILVMAEVTREVIERATDLRVRYRFKTPDAIHVATAIENGVDAFLTGDRNLGRCAEVKVIIV